MTRWILLAVLVVAITATATVVVQSLPADDSKASGRVAFPVASRSAESGPPPRVVVDGDLTYQFGTKAQLTTFEKDWVIRNEGQGDLSMYLEHPPCSCTVANFQGKDGKTSGTTITLHPGDSVPIHFTWDTKTYTGKYKKPAVIVTNDPERPRLEFAAEGEVFPAMVVYPEATVEFLDISTDESSHRRSVAVFSPDRADVKLTKMTSSKPELIVASHEPLTAEDCKKLKVKAGYRVHVDVNRGLPLGPFREEVVLETDHPKQPTVRLIVSGKVVGPISLGRDRLRITDGSTKAGGQGSLTMWVRGQRETHFAVLQEPRNLKVEVVPGDKTPKASKYTMTVKILPGTPPGEIQDLIILKTDHPQAGEVRIPVDVLIRDPS